MDRTTKSNTSLYVHGDLVAGQIILQCPCQLPTYFPSAKPLKDLRSEIGFGVEEEAYRPTTESRGVEYLTLASLPYVRPRQSYEPFVEVRGNKTSGRT